MLLLKPLLLFQSLLLFLLLDLCLVADLIAGLLLLLLKTSDFFLLAVHFIKYNLEAFLVKKLQLFIILQV